MRRSGNRRRVGGVTVYVAPGDSDRPRVAFVAGRTVGPAVLRNRAKRRLREAIGLIPLRDDCDYVVIATKAVTEVPFGDLTGWLWRAVAEEA